MLGKLEKVDLKTIWENEAYNFTPWLAQKENLELLGDAIGIELELEAQEKNVGPFRADILCKNTSDESLVLIENQIERTDHKHLGQLLTYAAGLQSVVIVWVASKFTEEHRKALDWLNDITDERFSFFGLEVELWKIGNSPAAPKFNIVSQPNNWSKTVARAAKNLDNQETKIISPISRVSAAPLLKGVMNCGICGSKMTPTYTSKKGKRYRYYICSASSKGNNDLCKVGRIPASEAENVVTSQILNILKKPEFIVQAISQSSKVFAENTVINNFKQIEKVWDELFPVEQARIINLLVKDIEVKPEGFNIRIFKEGINSLSNELTA